jgi:hypothetical protein
LLIDAFIIWFVLNYTENELDSIRQVLSHRYKAEIEIFLADCEVQLDKEKDEAVERPAVYWRAMDCNFIVVKLDQNRFEGRYFYQPSEHFSNAQQEYSDVVNCVTALLRSQADQSKEVKGVTSGLTGAELN